MRRLAQLWWASLAVCDQCQYDARWRKATQFLMVGIPTALQARLKKRCSGKTICSSSNKPHIVLTGVDPISRRFWTSLAQTYSRTFARTIADVLAQSFEQKSLVKYKILCG